jgi:hypothetical protein
MRWAAAVVRPMTRSGKKKTAPVNGGRREGPDGSAKVVGFDRDPGRSMLPVNMMLSGAMDRRAREVLKPINLRNRRAKIPPA